MTFEMNILIHSVSGLKESQYYNGSILLLLFCGPNSKLVPCCSMESMLALETQGIILVRDEALHPVPETTSTYSSVKVLQKGYNRGMQVRVLRIES